MVVCPRWCDWCSNALFINANLVSSNENIFFSRYLSSLDWRPVRLRARSTTPPASPPRRRRSSRRHRRRAGRGVGRCRTGTRDDDEARRAVLALHDDCPGNRLRRADGCGLLASPGEKRDNREQRPDGKHGCPDGAHQSPGSTLGGGAGAGPMI